MGIALGSTLVLRRRFDARGDAARDRRARRHRAGRRAGDAAAAARAGRRRRSRATTSARCASSPRAARRCRASSRRASCTRSATSSTTSTARPRSRGRRSPRRRTCARRPAPRDARRAARSSGSTTRTTARSPPARRAASSSATRWSSRATPAAAASRLHGLLSSGDFGHFDAEGRLFVDGRDDEMIVSGGENVFPREVEDLVARLPGVADVAAIGVEDERFGQRLKAFVVVAEGAALTERESRTTSARTSRVQGPARGRVRRRAPAQRHGQGAQARARRVTALPGPPGPTH